MPAKTLLLFLATTALCLADPAHADERGWYVAFGASITSLEDTSGTIANAPMPGSTVRTENPFENGYAIDLAAGRRLGDFRVEVEIGYAEDTQDSYTALVPPTGEINADVTQTTLKGMINGYYDFTFRGARPYVGAGVGAAMIDLEFIAPRAPFPNEAPLRLIDDGDTRFAYQLMAGVSFPVSERVSLGIGYRWFDAGTLEVQDLRNEAVTRDHKGHALGARVSFQF